LGAVLKVCGLIVGLAVVLTAGGIADAQKVVRAPVAEDFAPSVKVSGEVLVGVVIGSLAGSADPRKLVVPSTKETAGQPLCFAAKTRDGQYVAGARLPSGVVPGEDFVIEPERPWKHLAALAAYSFGDFATLVRLGSDCTMNAKAPVMPVRYPSSGTPQLFVFINTQRSLSATATVEWGDGRRATGTCKSADLAQVRSAAFDMVCTIALPESQAGDAKLTISRRARMGTATDVVDLKLPPAVVRR